MSEDSFIEKLKETSNNRWNKLQNLDSLKRHNNDANLSESLSPKKKICPAKPDSYEAIEKENLLQSSNNPENDSTTKQARGRRRFEELALMRREWEDEIPTPPKVTKKDFLPKKPETVSYPKLNTSTSSPSFSKPASNNNDALKFVRPNSQQFLSPSVVSSLENQGYVQTPTHKTLRYDYNDSPEVFNEDSEQDTSEVESKPMEFVKLKPVSQPPEVATDSKHTVCSKESHISKEDPSQASIEPKFFSRNSFKDSLKEATQVGIVAARQQSFASRIAELEPNKLKSSTSEILRKAPPTQPKTFFSNPSLKDKNVQDKPVLRPVLSPDPSLMPVSEKIGMFNTSQHRRDSFAPEKLPLHQRVAIFENAASSFKKTPYFKKPLLISKNLNLSPFREKKLPPTPEEKDVPQEPSLKTDEETVQPKTTVESEDAIFDSSSINKEDEEEPAVDTNSTAVEDSHKPWDNSSYTEEEYTDESIRTSSPVCQDGIVPELDFQDEGVTPEDDEATPEEYEDCETSYSSSSDLLQGSFLRTLNYEIGNTLDEIVEGEEGHASPEHESDLDMESEEDEDSHKAGRKIDRRDPLSLSVYRQEQKRLNTPMKPVVHLEVSTPSEDDKSEEHVKLIKEKIRNLENAVSLTKKQLEQSNQLVEECIRNPKFYMTVTQLEGEKIIFIKSRIKAACLDEIKECKKELENGPKDKGSLGQLTLEGISLSLKNEALMNAEKEEILRKFFCIVKYREQVMATEIISIKDAEMGQLKFTNYMVFKDLTHDFNLKVEIFASAIKKEKDETKTPKKNKSCHLKKDNKKELPITSFNSKPQLKTRPIGSLNLNLKNCDKRTHMLDGGYASSSIGSSMSLKASITVKYDFKIKGFLTMYEDVSGYGNWERRYCSIEGTQIIYWKYPENKDERPLGVIDLRHCPNRQVNVLSRDIQPRSNTFQLTITRPHEDDDTDDLITQVCEPMTCIRHQIAADSIQELQIWCRKINRLLKSIHNWDSSSLPCLDESQ